MGFFMGCFGCGQDPRAKNWDRVCPERASTDGGEAAPVAAAAVVKRFSWEEIERLTMNFKEVIGVGGYSMVYLAKFPNSTLGAVKIYNTSERLNQVFKNELEICQKLHHHPHIVKLLGYCDERDEGVLVFEYIPNGNLQECLHNQALSSPQTTTPKPANTNITLSWKQRMQIAYQLAKTLDHLHEESNPHIIHGDIKVSNILLDGRLECQLSDFGCAQVGFSSLVKPPTSSRMASMMVGSPGYVDPHFIMTGMTSKKSDVYSFGVVLLELITGVEACTCKGDRHVLLTSRVKTQDKFDVGKVIKMVDKRVVVDEEELKAIASIAGDCLHHLPSLRPSTSEICRMMKEKIPSVSSVLMPSEKL